VEVLQFWHQEAIDDRSTNRSSRLLISSTLYIVVSIMTVTEIAVLPLAGLELTTEFQAIVDQAQSIQDTWYSKHSPDKPASRRARGAGNFQQIENPSNILITAQWESPEEHWQWIGSENNASAMGKIVPHLHAEYATKVVLFHADAIIFMDEAEGKTSLLDSPFISVSRTYVEAAMKQGFQDKFNEVKGILEEYAAPNIVRGGWRIERESDDAEEFVLITGWEAVEDHMAFAKSEGFAKFIGIQAFAKGSDIKHYRRFM
jgi:heme-degrading monooxygenase HmoA